MTDFDPTKPVRQRNGREARILATDCRADYPIVAEILRGDGAWTLHFFQRDGRAICFPETSLVNIPERVSWFVVVRKSEGMTRFTKEKEQSYSVNGTIELIFEGDEFIEAKYHRS
jgi:hypothetical protein